MPYIKVRGFAPDADLTQEGTFRPTSEGGFIPTLRGVASIPSDADSGISAVASTVASAVSVELTSGANRLIVGTGGGGSNRGKLYEVSTTDWTDVTRGSGGDYTATADVRWTFAEYNDRVFAAQKSVTIQGSTGGEFTAVAGGAPAAAVVVNVLDFVMAFNTNEATYGDSPNRWWCCAAGDPDSWTANIATQATTGLLTDSPGRVIAASRLGSNVVAYKNTSMYFGQYVNAPAVWGWRLVPGEGLGTWSPYSLVDVEGVGHLFIGYNNIFIFDGSRAQPIGDNRVAEYFFDDLDYAKAQLIVGFHDQPRFNVYWWYPSIAHSDGMLDKFIVYNYRTREWGYGFKTIQFALAYLEPGISYDGLGTFYSTYADLPISTYDNAFSSSSTFKPATFNTSNELKKWEGPGASSKILTNFYGTDDQTSNITRVRPRFQVAPSGGAMVHLVTDTVGSVAASANAVSYARGVFDSVYASRWHQFEIDFTGSWEMTGISIIGGIDGDE